MNQLIVKLVFILSFIILPLQVGCSISRSEIEKEGANSIFLMKKILGNSITVREDTSGINIEYCPDNTCESFKSPISKSFSILSDFAYIYLFYISDYYYLTHFRKKTPLERISQIVNRNIGSCREKEKIEIVKCVLMSLSDKYSIKVIFVRYDEGKRNEVIIDLKEQLKKLSNLP